MYRLINSVFNVVNRYCPILIQTPWPTGFGECAIEMRRGLLKAQREHKRTLFVVHRHELWGRLRVPISNRELFLLESEHLYPSRSVLSWLSGWLLTANLGLVRPWIVLWRSEKWRRGLRRVAPSVRKLSGPPFFGAPTIPTIGTPRLWQTDTATTFSWEVVKELNWREQYARYRPPRLTDAKRKFAGQLRLEMGIPSSDWFVALHVREGGDRGGSMSISYRDSSIGNYLDAIRVITQAGGWVVRLGDASVTPLPAMERVVDYARSRWKSELMDLYLISECRFFFGTTSGPCDVAFLFDRPVLAVNVAAWRLWAPFRSGDLGILKHVFSSRAGRVLTVGELVEEPLASQFVETPVESHGYLLIENSSDEIRDVVEEFMRPDRGPISELQQACNTAMSRAIHRWVDRGELKESSLPEFVVTDQYQIASWADVTAGALGQQYLEQHWDTVPRWLTELSHELTAQASGPAEDSGAPIVDCSSGLAAPKQNAKAGTTDGTRA